MYTDAVYIGIRKLPTKKVGVFQCPHQYNLRAVIEAERYDAVANTAADNHVRAAIRI